MELTSRSSTPTSIADLLSRLRSLLPFLSKQYRVRSLALFGSYARLEQNPKSDLDVLVEFDEPPSLLEFVRMERFLSESLGVEVDLVMKDALKPAISRHILKELVPV